MTTSEYKIIMAAIRKKTAELKASPAAAKKFLIDNGLGDILENAPPIVRHKKSTSGRKTTASK